MFTFVLFGTSLIWTGLGIAGVGTLLFAAAVFGARVLAFIPALLPARLSWNHRWLIAWFGPRGLSSLLLVLLPVFAGLPGSETLLTICCLVVLCSVILHGISPMVLIRTEPDNAAVPAPSSPFPILTAAHQAPVPGSSGLDDPQYLSVEDVLSLQQRQSVPVVIVDARSERTYDESTEVIPGAIRLHPDRALQMAEQYKIAKGDVLAVLCA
jgi:hypothetical protein